MANALDAYQMKKEYLICVDSDGCAMDTMDIKHFRCFGPCMVEEWGLEAWGDSILKRWNDINLYTMTRGINRFKGLAMALEEINRQYTPVEDIETLLDWAETSPELSNAALERALQEKESVSLRKALSWSQKVNRAITALPEEEILPYEGVKQALAFVHERADVAIVSSANLGAVLDEWKRHGLLEHTDIVLAQDAGSKAHCIAELLQKGYSPSHVLMCGDAPGDMQAAQKNGVFYFPILVKHEKESWQELMATAFDRLLAGTYAGPYQKMKNEQFVENLSAR